MRVVVTGGTGVLGRAAVAALLGAGHHVRVTTRGPDDVALVRSLGAEPVGADLFAVDTLAEAFTGAEAVVNLASRVPVGYAMALPGAWRHNDALCIAGVRALVEAAGRADVRRIVQHSSSLLYADGGEDWITEHAPLEITTATEPMSAAEARVQGFAGRSRSAVVLRLGRIVGDHPRSRRAAPAAHRHRTLGVGRPDAWVHLLHADDVGPVVLAGLTAPTGTYNVGAEPVRRGELAAARAERGGPGPRPVPWWVLRRVAGPRVEPLFRSLRVSSEEFVAHTGWRPRRPRFAPDWLDTDALEPAS